MIRTLFLLLIGCLLFGCVQTDDYSSVTPTIIGQGNLFGNGEENIAQQAVAISDSVSWNKLVSQMNSVNSVSDDFLETNIDFSQYTVLAVFDQVRSGSGYSIDINIVEDAKSVFVDIVYKKPPENAFLISVMTQPFLIVKIPKTTKEILFDTTN